MAAILRSGEAHEVKGSTLSTLRRRTNSSGLESFLFRLGALALFFEDDVLLARFVTEATELRNAGRLYSPLFDITTRHKMQHGTGKSGFFSLFLLSLIRTLRCYCFSDSFCSAGGS